MKTKIYALLALSFIATSAYSGQEKGGGDICEDRIQEVRNDIRAWIEKKGYVSLKLPASVNHEQYAQSMLSQIKAAKIRCVSSGDEGHPVQVFGTPKICRFEKGTPGTIFRRGTSSNIVCDFHKFMDLGEDDQYKLVHHEYAGLADVELPNRDDSNYDVSNQLSKYLTKQTVSRLSIVPRQAPPQEPSNPYAKYPLAALPIKTEITIQVDQIVVPDYGSGSDYKYLGGFSELNVYAECFLRFRTPAVPQTMKGTVKLVVARVVKGNIIAGEGTTFNGKLDSRFAAIECGTSKLPLGGLEEIIKKDGGSIKFGEYTEY